MFQLSNNSRIGLPQTTLYFLSCLILVAFCKSRQYYFDDTEVIYMQSIQPFLFVKERAKTNK